MNNSDMRCVSRSIKPPLLIILQLGLSFDLKEALGPSRPPFGSFSFTTTVSIVSSFAIIAKRCTERNAKRRKKNQRDVACGPMRGCVTFACGGPAGVASRMRPSPETKSVWWSAIKWTFFRFKSKSIILEQRISLLKHEGERTASGSYVFHWEQVSPSMPYVVEINYQPRRNEAK